MAPINEQSVLDQKDALWWDSPTKTHQNLEQYLSSKHPQGDKVVVTTEGSAYIGDSPFYDIETTKPAEWNKQHKGWTLPGYKITLATDESVAGRGAEGYRILSNQFQTASPFPEGEQVVTAIDYKGFTPSGADYPDGFLNNMFDNENWKSLSDSQQQALYNKAFLGDYDVAGVDGAAPKPFTSGGDHKKQAAEFASSDRVWGTSHDSTHGLDIARVAVTPPTWNKGDPIDVGAMDKLYKQMTEGAIDWAHYNDDGLYQAAAWQLDQDGNKHWIDQSASGFSTVDQIRSVDALLGTMNAKEEAELLDTWKQTSAHDAWKNPSTTITKIPTDYQSLNPTDVAQNDGTWQHTNTEGVTVDRHYTPTYQQIDYQVPDPGDPLKFTRVNEGDPRAGQWDSESNTLTWGGKDIDAIRNTKLTPRSEVVPPTVNIPSNMTQQIYRPDNLPANVYGTITSDAIWTDPKTGKDKFAAGGKSQSLTIKDGKLIKGDTYTPRSQNLSDMTIKAGGK